MVSISGIGAISFTDPAKGIGSVKEIGKTSPVTPKIPQIGEDFAVSTPLNQVTPLQSANALQIPAAALAILQADDAASANILSALGGGKDNGIGALLGDTSSNNLLGSLFSGAGNSNNPFSNLLQQAAAKSEPLGQAVAAAAQAQANSATQESPVQALLAQTHAASNAYNKVLLQNAQNLLQAGETQPLVA